MSIKEDLDRDLEAAQRAMGLFDDACAEYRAACQRFDWVTAEIARAAIMASMDAYLDQIAAMHKRMESECPGRPSSISSPRR